MSSLLFDLTDKQPSAQKAPKPAKKAKPSAPLKAKVPAVMGRPTGYSIEIATEICNVLATGKEGFEAACKKVGVASKSAWTWLSKHEDFWRAYTRAREFQTELMYDDISWIANAPLTHNGREVDAEENPGMPLSGAEAFAETNRRKLMIDVMKFKLIKLQPRRFGNNQDVNHNVNVQHKLTSEQFDALLQVHTKAAQIGPGQTEDEEYTDHEEI